MSLRLDQSLARLTPYAPTALRAALGLVFVAHAYGKAAIFTFPGSEAFFAANGFPAWTVYPVFALELLGGLALLAGYRVRVVALALLPVMVGAVKPHLANGWLFSGSGGGWEYPAFLVIALAVQSLLGAGAFALDPQVPVKTSAKTSEACESLARAS